MIPCPSNGEPYVKGHNNVYVRSVLVDIFGRFHNFEPVLLFRFLCSTNSIQIVVVAYSLTELPHGSLPRLHGLP